MYKLLYCIAGKFGGKLNLAVWQSVCTTAELKSAKVSNYYIMHTGMAIPYQTAKYKICQYFCNGDLGSNCQIQYFSLYSNIILKQKFQIRVLDFYRSRDLQKMF